MQHKAKRNIISITVIIIIIALAFTIWLFTRPKSLGNIAQAYLEPETSISNISFSCNANDRIKFSFMSEVENGELNIRVYDSHGTIVKELDRAKELVDYLTLDNSDTYTLEANLVDFIGNFEVTVYKVD